MNNPNSLINRSRSLATKKGITLKEERKPKVTEYPDFEPVNTLDEELRREKLDKLRKEAAEEAAKLAKHQKPKKKSSVSKGDTLGECSDLLRQIDRKLDSA